MATKKRSRRSPLKGRRHTHQGSVRKHKRRVNGVNPAVVSGMKRKRRKKVSGIGGGEIMQALLGLAGGVGTGILIDKVTPASINPNLKEAGKGLLGAGALYYGIKNKKMSMIGAGLGLTGHAVNGLAHSTGVVQGVQDFMAGIGIGNDNDEMLIEINGMDDTNGTTIMGLDQSVPVISGAMPSVVSGAMPSVVSGQ